MPAVRCPNCGTTITLKERKEIDFKLILNALKNSAKSFSELLRITGLPRKTLNLRLKELCNEGAIFKDKQYHLNSSKNLFLSTPINLRFMEDRKKVALFLLLLLAMPTATGFVVAITLQSAPKPQPIGNLRVIVKVNNVSDVYGWQVGLSFESAKTKVSSFRPGDFFGNQTEDISLSENVQRTENTLFISNLKENMLILCQTFIIDIPGINGSGSLAVVEFQYYSLDYDIHLIFNSPLGTMLLRKDASEIPIDNNTVVLHFENLP